MKKKTIVILLATIGFALLALGIVLALSSTFSKNIIGGAGFPTFVFVFMYENGGVCFYSVFFGVVMMLASLFVGVLKRK